MAAATAVVPPGEATLEDEEEVAELGSRYWLQSGMTEEYLQELEEGGFIPSKADCSWRAPGEELIPDPQDGELVVLASHCLRGMSLPLSVFFLSVLQFYGLQPHNIAPNSILVLAGFQALCEGYLGIDASLELFQYCFLCRRQTIAGGQLATCGSVTFNCRQPDWYPKIPYIESVKNWTSTFFYCKDIPTPGQELRFPAYVNGPPTHQAGWAARVALGDLPEDLRLAVRRIEFLTSTMDTPPSRLDGTDTVICWLKRSLMPLRHRPIKMCEYEAEAAGNSTLSEKMLLWRLRELIKPQFVKPDEGCPMFTHDNPVPAVSFDFLVFA
jgi:hypothetical protein